MNLCADNHEEICFDGRDCPACSIVKEVAYLQDKIQELEELLDKDRD